MAGCLQRSARRRSQSPRGRHSRLVEGEKAMHRQGSQSLGATAAASRLRFGEFHRRRQVDSPVRASNTPPGLGDGHVARNRDPHRGRQLLGRELADPGAAPAKLANTIHVVGRRRAGARLLSFAAGRTPAFLRPPAARVLLDLKMPKVDRHRGLRAVRAIRARRSSRRRADLVEGAARSRRELQPRRQRLDREARRFRTVPGGRRADRLFWLVVNEPPRRSVSARAADRA